MDGGGGGYLDKSSLSAWSGVVGLFSAVAAEKAKGMPEMENGPGPVPHVVLSPCLIAEGNGVEDPALRPGVRQKSVLLLLFFLFLVRIRHIPRIEHTHDATVHNKFRHQSDVSRDGARDCDADRDYMSWCPGLPYWGRQVRFRGMQIVV